MATNTFLKSLVENQKEERFRPVFKLDVEETFPQGIEFKKISVGFKYEDGKLTEEMDSIKVVVSDVKSGENIQIKLPINTSIPEDILDKKNQPVRFTNLQGGRLDKGYWFKADTMEFI